MTSKDTDILAYVRLDSHVEIVAALEAVIGPLVRDHDFFEGQFLYHCGAAIILIQPSEDGFLSVWIRRHAHWKDDVELGRYLFKVTGATVRCDPGAHHPEVHPASDVFMEIGADGEKLLEWG